MYSLFQGVAQGKNVIGEEIKFPAKQPLIAFSQPGDDPGRQWLTGYTFERRDLNKANAKAHPGRFDALENKQRLIRRVRGVRSKQARLMRSGTTRKAWM